MHSSVGARGFVQRDIDEDVDVNIDKVSDDDNWSKDDERENGSSKSKKRGSSEEAHEIQRRIDSSSGVDSGQDDYEDRELLHSKQMKRKSEENTLVRLSTWYQDGEAENKVEGGDKFVSSGYSRAGGGERKISTAKYPDNDFDGENRRDKNSKFAEGRNSGRDKEYGYGAHGRRTKRRWDEPDTVVEYDNYVEYSDVGNGKSSDWKPACASASASASAIKRTDSLEIESNAIKSLGPESINDHIMSRREERKVDLERSDGWKFEALEKDAKGSLTRQNRSNKERHEECRQKRHGGRDLVDDSERSEEDGNPMRDKNRRDMEGSNASVIPEKIGRHQFGSDNFEINDDGRNIVRRKESVKDGSCDEKLKVGDDYSIEHSGEQVKFKDSGKREEDKETRDGEKTYDKSRDWEIPRRGLEWMGERRRKDGNRTEAVKTSSKYGISNENYDVIEIQTKPFDYGGEDSSSIYVRNREVIWKTPTNLPPDINELSYSRDEMLRNNQGSGQAGEEYKDRFMDSTSAVQDQNSLRDENDFHSEKSRGPRGMLRDNGTGGQSSGSVSLPPHGNHENSSFNRSNSQGLRGNRAWRGGRGRPTGRDTQQPGTPMPMVGSPFGPLGVPPLRPMYSSTPNMSPAPGPPISAGVFPFQPPIMWPGARGVEMNILGVQPGLLPGPTPRFSPNFGNSPNGPFVFNPLGPGRGTSPSISGQNFNAFVPMVHGQLHDKTSGGWVPPRSNIPSGKAPSRGEQNDYSQNFVDTGMRPQNFIRELELTSVVEDYPKLRDLIQRKDEIVAKSASPPMYYKCDLREHVLSHEFFGTKFDVVLIDPPWEEYVHRAPGVTEHMEYWTFEEIMNLKIEAISDTPSFIFLWVGDGVGLEQGRQCLKKWGFRRCEDICWVKTNKTSATPGLRHDSHTLFQRSKEHCLMGIKGTVRRSTDGHIIHANIDTDVIIAEDPPYGSTAKPEDMYRIIEHFALGRRRLELFGGDHNIRSGWLTVGKELSSSNFNSEAYVKNFVDKDGKIWVGVGGRNPPQEAPHLVLTTPEIESLRPKSPMKNQQQQSSSSITLTNIISSNKWPTGTSPQNHNANQEIYSPNMQSAAP